MSSALSWPILQALLLHRLWALWLQCYIYQPGDHNGAFFCTYTADKVRNSVLKFWPSELVAITYCTSKVRDPVSRFTSRYHFHRRRLLQTLQPARRLYQYYLITQLSWIVLFIMMFEVREDLMYYLWLTRLSGHPQEKSWSLIQAFMPYESSEDWSN